jgi:hypothetical protein
MPIKYIIVIVAYAAALVVIGAVTYATAPSAANAFTAVIVSAAFAAIMLACAALSATIKQNYKLGMIGIHAALVFPLICAAGPFSRLGGSMAGAELFNTNHDLVLERLAGEDTAPGSAVRLSVNDTGFVVASTPEGEEIFRLPPPDIDAQGNAQQPDTGAWRKAYSPQGYQTVGLTSIAVVSIFAFIALITHRPKVTKPAKAKKNDDHDDDR